MKLALVALALTLPLAAKPKIDRPRILSLEQAMDRTLERNVLDDNRYLLLGYTRGVYLEGTGAVFSAEVNLAAGPTITPFHQEITKDDTARLRQKKLDKLPALRSTMRQLLFDLASKLDGVAPDEEIVVAVTLFQHRWEDSTGLPAQIVMRASRKRLSEIPTTKRDPAQLDGLIKTEEF